jgi:hypothetical protein
VMLSRVPPLLVYGWNGSFSRGSVARLRARTRGWIARLPVLRRASGVPSSRVVRWLFLRALGLVYLAAFGSLSVQVRGLYGTRGIAPVRELLDGARALPPRERWRELPTLFWLAASDRTLVFACGVGNLASLLLTFNIAPRLAIAVLWTVYLSFVKVGRDFLSFQWDALLLETSVHALLIAPPGLRPRLGRDEPPWPAVLLLRWLVFRLNYQSGVAKLRSGDPTWRDRTACCYHFETQPLPTRLGWRAHQLPARLKRLSSSAVLGCERYGPFLIFAPRGPRRAGFYLLSGLQGVIAATGNYAFFNALSGALTLWMLDDQALPPGLSQTARRSGTRARPIRRYVSGLVAALAFAASWGQHLLRYGRRRPPAVIRRAIVRMGPLHSINTYGLFSVMTTHRGEITIEGSDDGVTWLEYEFRYKPGDTHAAPRWVAPHQPRLDWQMWFAALQPPPPWFARLLVRLLEGSPEVLALFKRVPFGAHPPRYVRAVMREYHMTTLETRRRTGAWWECGEPELYFPAVTLALGDPSRPAIF